MKTTKGRNNGILKTLEPGDKLPGAGHPKGQQNTATRMKRLFELVVIDKNPITGKNEKFTGAELLDMALFKKALKGDVNAYREIMDRVEGKVIQPMDVNTQEFTEIKLIHADGKVLSDISTSEQEAIEKMKNER
jgi:hypothetical protein